MKLPPLMLDANLSALLQLSAHVRDGSTQAIEFDASELLAIEPVGACLFASASRAAERAGRKLEISHWSPRLRSLLQDMGCNATWRSRQAYSGASSIQVAPALAMSIQSRREANRVANELSDRIAQFIPEEDRAGMLEDHQGLRIYHSIQPPLAYVLSIDCLLYTSPVGDRWTKGSPGYADAVGEAPGIYAHARWVEAVRSTLRHVNVREPIGRGRDWVAGARLGSGAGNFCSETRATTGEPVAAPWGVAMIQFYFMPAPNPAKVALMLEETGLPYEAIAVDGRKGQQFAPDYLTINPNAKAPSIVDGDVTVFDSNAILLYLAEKTGKFLPAVQIQHQI